MGHSANYGRMKCDPPPTDFITLLFRCGLALPKLVALLIAVSFFSGLVALGFIFISPLLIKAYMHRSNYSKLTFIIKWLSIWCAVFDVLG